MSININPIKAVDIIVKKIFLFIETYDLKAVLDDPACIDVTCVLNKFIHHS